MTHAALRSHDALLAQQGRVAAVLRLVQHDVQRLDGYGRQIAHCVGILRKTEGTP